MSKPVKSNMTEAGKKTLCAFSLQPVGDTVTFKVCKDVVKADRAPSWYSKRKVRPSQVSGLGLTPYTRAVVCDCGGFDPFKNIAWDCLIHSGLAESRGSACLGEICLVFFFFFFNRSYSTSLQYCKKTPEALEIA